MRMNATYQPGSRRANDSLTMYGGPGNDYLQMSIYDLAEAHVSGQIDGGGGVNTALHTSNVTAVNCTWNIVTNRARPFLTRHF
jgi:hypothetical protein